MQAAPSTVALLNYTFFRALLMILVHPPIVMNFFTHNTIVHGFPIIKLSCLFSLFAREVLEGSRCFIYFKITLRTQ